MVIRLKCDSGWVTFFHRFKGNFFQLWPSHCDTGVECASEISYYSDDDSLLHRAEQRRASGRWSTQDHLLIPVQTHKVTLLFPTHQCIVFFIQFIYYLLHIQSDTFISQQLCVRSFPE